MSPRMAHGPDTLLEDYTISRLDLPETPVAEGGMPVRDVIRRMQEHRVGCVPVCRDGRVEGVFTDHDVLNRVLGKDGVESAPVRTVMSAPAVTITGGDSLAEAVRRMDRGRFRHLPVVDHQGRPRAILSVRRILSFLAEFFPAEVINLAPHPDLQTGHRTPEGG